MAMSATAAARPLTSVSTRPEREAERFGVFCDAICDVYLGIRPHRLSDRPFDAEFTAFDLGGPVLARMSAPGHAARRTRRLVADSPDPAVYLNLAALAPSRIEHLGRNWALPATTPFLIDSESPFDLRFDPTRRFRLTSLRIPKAALGDPDAAAVRRADERLGTTPLGSAIGTQARLLASELDAGRADVAAAMSGPLLLLLERLIAPGAVTRNDRVDALRTLARSHLGDPAFGVRELARLAGCSTRTIQSAFAAAGETFAEWWLAERLDAARARIGDPRWRRRSIAEIAASTGFRDVSAFHRVFKSRFGASPGAYRPGA